MKILYLLFILIPGITFSQEPAEGVFDLKDGEIYYDRITEPVNVSKTELFARAKIWAAAAFESEKKALQSEDKNLGWLIYKTVQSSFVLISGLGVQAIHEFRYSMDIRIYLEDNKAKIVVDNLTLDAEELPHTTLLHFKEGTEEFLKNKKWSKNKRYDLYQGVHFDFIKIEKTIHKLLVTFEETLSKKSVAEYRFSQTRLSA